MPSWSESKSLFAFQNSEITDLEAETMDSVAFSIYKRNEMLLLDDRIVEERIIENFKLFNPKSPCGPSIFQ